jgi:hypothetical protein
VPLNIADEIPAVADSIRAQERRVIQYCHSPGFNIGELPSVVAINSSGVSSEDQKQT